MREMSMSTLLDILIQRTPRVSRNKIGGYK